MKLEKHENPLSKYLDPQNDNRHTGCVKRIREGGRRATLLLFDDGQRIKAFPYSYFVHLDYHPKDGLTLTYTSGKVVMTGRNLLTLCGDLDEGRITHIFVAQAPPASQDAVHIETITYDLF